MGKRFGWLAALGLALGAASGAGAATLSPMVPLPLREGALPSVAAPPPGGLQRFGSEDTQIGEPPADPAVLMLLATGLGGLVVLGHREFV